MRLCCSNDINSVDENDSLLYGRLERYIKGSEFQAQLGAQTRRDLDEVTAYRAERHKRQQKRGKKRRIQGNGPIRAQDLRGYKARSR